MKFVAVVLLALPMMAGEFNTYLADGYPYSVSAMTADAAGNLYITGSRLIIPPTSTDIFLTKLDSTGKIVFTITLGGKGIDRASAVALDPSGNIYVAGSTTSPDFPLSRAVQSTPAAGGSGFIVKLSPDGGTILYSTYFGGTLGVSSVAGVATDSLGNLYVTGATYSPDFPVTKGMPDGRGKVSSPVYQGAFVAKIQADGGRIIYGGLLVGVDLPADASSDACRAGNSYRLTTASGIGVDASGNAYLAGNTSTIDLPATGSALVKQGVGAFVAKVNSAGTGLDYLTYLDATDNCSFPVASLSAIAVDAGGTAYLAGMTTDPKYTVTAGASQTAYGGTGAFGGDAFVTALRPDGSTLAWSTFLGGTDADVARTIALDAAGGVWVSGTTSSLNFPNANGWSNGFEFLVGFNRSGSTLTFAARYPKGGVAAAIAAGSTPGLVYTAGANGLAAAIPTAVLPSPRIFGVVSTTGERVAPFFELGYGTIVTGRIAPGELITIYGSQIGPATPVAGTFNAAGFLPANLGGITVTMGALAAPLIYVSENRIDAVVPLGLLTGVQDIAVSQKAPGFRSVVVETAPSIYLGTDGNAAALNQDGTVNSSTNPAALGSVVSIWATGTGSHFAPLLDGQLATSANNNCHACRVGQPGSLLTPQYAGAAPGLPAGVTQINVALPNQWGSIIYPITLSVNGAATTASVWVRDGIPFGGIL